jgi:hypothetical protein
MATLTPGTGGTLKSTSLEQCFHEALCRAVLLEQDSTKNPRGLNRLTLRQDARNGQAEGSFTFEVSKAISGGNPIFTAIEHLTSGYSPGTGGTLKSLGLCGAILELAELIQAKQPLKSKNPQSFKTITALTYDSVGLVVAGLFDYPIVELLTSSGEFATTAKTYLLD